MSETVDRLTDWGHYHAEEIEPGVYHHTFTAPTMSVEDMLAALNRSEQGYRRLVFGEWTGPTVEEQRMEAIANAYHARCDRFDAGLNPRDASYLRQVNANALRVRRSLMEEYCITERELHDAIAKYSKYHTKGDDYHGRQTEQRNGSR